MSSRYSAVDITDDILAPFKQQTTTDFSALGFQSINQKFPRFSTSLSRLSVTELWKLSAPRVSPFLSVSAYISMHIYVYTHMILHYE